MAVQAEDVLHGPAAALLLVFTLLDKRVDIPRCAMVCKEWRKTCHNCTLWKSLSLAGTSEAGKRISYFVAQSHFQALKELDLEFAQGVEDQHVRLLASFGLESLNLNACQDVGEQAIIDLIKGPAGSTLRMLSFYWNLKVRDRTLKAISEHCSQLTDLNFSGCKYITDEGLHCLAAGLPKLLKLNLTRCPLVQSAALECCVAAHPSLTSLLLYANASLTDPAFQAMAVLTQLTHLDLCGMQFMTDEGLAAIAACTQLSILNLSWCVRITDVGLCVVAEACQCLSNLSVYGVRGVTDLLIQALARSCKASLHTLDVRGCLGVQGRAPEDLLLSLPNIECFIVHS
eukprot:CAMPEP_0196595358 /NCGR_PEP_ID=MMETSP1081-20130531/80908_1 /TAXON_ID=36882 /ORGANISM="Pyramimonas amylifera, Strain CCMP720" /LENGTH=342 /DNA_ID=CAMNT_0041919903 /DNA_START=50 /DNA_END=1078 /DNA_ORIENTATION=+